MLNRLESAVRSTFLNTAKKVFWALPTKSRYEMLDWSYRRMPALFRGSPHYERWRGLRLEGPQFGNAAELINIDNSSEEKIPNGKIAIHLHIFRGDTWNHLLRLLEEVPFDFDLFISSPGGDSIKNEIASFKPKSKIKKVYIVASKYSDDNLIYLFTNFAIQLSDYRYFGHFHSGNSNNKELSASYSYNLHALLGSPGIIKNIIGMLNDPENSYGVIYPQNISTRPYYENTWLGYLQMSSVLGARFGYSPMPKGYLDFPAGSMFWSAGEALRPLFDLGRRGELDLSPNSQAVLSESLKRLFVLSAQRQGFKTAIIKDQKTPSWSSWRFDQYFAQSFDDFKTLVNSDETKVVVFDIFDTLLQRNFIDPESVKEIVSRRIGGQTGQLYLQFRATAESQARALQGKDVGLNEIYIYFQKITGLDEVVIKKLRALEEEVECLSVSARHSGVELYAEALASGKPIALVSDMFLSKNEIENTLNENKITGWNALYLSSQTGLRKDTGAVYDLLFSDYCIDPKNLMVVGDNEYSDIHIPKSKGAKAFHIMKSSNIARGVPRLRALIEAVESDENLEDKITMGLVVSEIFSDVFYPDFDHESLFPPSAYNIGYGILGPILTSFSSWLLNQAKEKKISTLYFLAREGEIMKTIYDIWAKDNKNSPFSKYLVVSRRAVSVPTISSMEDIVSIASATYYRNSIENFLKERFGLHLDAKQWKLIRLKTNWTPAQSLEVKNANVQHIYKLLEFLKDEIFAVAALELPMLNKYLESQNLFHPATCALVDIGYSATIQNYLCRITQKPIHAFYMMANQKALDVKNTYNVEIEGCFMNNTKAPHAEPYIYQHSFDLEKMMSSDSPQIISYSENNNQIFGNFREQNFQNTLSKPLRLELKRGAIAYAEKAVSFRNHIWCEFVPSTSLASALFNAFVCQRSQAESRLLQNLPLDDDYYGRGQVY
jgi:predicted HAD superfamily hydrolase